VNGAHMVIPQDMPVMEMAIVAAHALVMKLMNNEHVSVLFSNFEIFGMAILTT
jgi:hypothetical protein